ncbi:MAG: hypothetical protein ACLFUS_06375 [Candidatus Sumerlaeia bacterium]
MNSGTIFGILNVISLIYLTAVVALVIGLQEADDQEQPMRHVLGCWMKLLGCLLGIGVVVYLLSLFGG